MLFHQWVDKSTGGISALCGQPLPARPARTAGALSAGADIARAPALPIVRTAQKPLRSVVAARPRSFGPRSAACRAAVAMRNSLDLTGAPQDTRVVVAMSGGV